MSRDRQADRLAREADAARDLIAALASDDDTLNHDMVEGETGLFEAIDAALAEIDECDVVAEGCREKERQMAERRDKAQRRRDRLRGLIEQALVVADLGSVKRPTATLTVKDLKPKPLVTDEAQIPARFWKQPDPRLDMKAILEAVGGGEQIPGVTMSNGTTSLQIRRQ